MRRLRAFVAPVGLSWRRLRSDPLFAASLFVAAATTTFLFALVPQVFDRLSEDSLEQTVDRASPRERDLAITGVGQIGASAGAQPLDAVTDLGEAYERRFPEPVRAVIGARRTAVDTVRYTLVAAPGEDEPAGTMRFLTLRHVGDAFDHVEIAQGSPPSDRAGAAELPFGDGGAATGLEIALSATTARQLSLELGDRIFALPAPDDPLVRGVSVFERRYVALHLVGILDRRGAGDAAWLRDWRLGRADVHDTEAARIVSGRALFSADAYNEVLAGAHPVPLRYEWQYLVDPAAVAGSDPELLAAGVRQIQSAFGQGGYGQHLALGVQTGLARIIERYETDRRAAGAVLAVAGIALLAVALAVLGILAALATERRRDGIALLRSRGGSLSQTLATQALEGLLVAAPAGLLGYISATLAAGRAPGVLPALLVLGIVVATAALGAAATLGPARRALAARERDDAQVGSAGPFRLAFEGLVASVALAGAYLLRRRGLDADAGFDPFLAAVPVLVGLAVGLLALRLSPLPLRVLARAAARRPGLVAALGLQRLARQSSLAAAPLLVVLLATAVGVFAATTAGTISAAQRRAAEPLLTPLDTGTLDVFRAGIVVAGAYAALALALAPVLTARARGRDVAYLRALGLPGRDIVRLTAFELGPAVAVAVTTGILLGVGLAYLVEPALDLSALAGGERAVLRPGILGPALLAAGLVVVTAAVALVTAAAARRASLDRVLRAGGR